MSGPEDYLVGPVLSRIASFGEWAIAGWLQEVVCMSGRPFGFVDEEGNVKMATLIPLSLLMLVVRLVFDLVFTLFSVKIGIQLGEARKFRESSFKFLFYFSSWMMCVYVMSLEDYWPNVRNTWVGVVDGTQPCPPVLQAYYVWELSYYTSSLIATVILDERLKDFYILMTHHVVTILLLSMSYFYGYHRIGILVLYCHDFSDIFLESAKIFVYLKHPFPFCNYGADVLFSMLVLSWPYFRLYLLPFKVIYSVTYHNLEIIGYENFNHYYPFNGLLYTLVVFHLYWYFLILRVLQKVLFKGIREDVREEKPVINDWALRLLAIAPAQGTSPKKASSDKPKAKKMD